MGAFALLPVSVVDVLSPDVLTIRREVIAGGSVDVATTDKEEDVAVAGAGGGGDDVSTAPCHVSRRAVPLLAAVRLQILQVECVPVVQEQGLARP
jgi:hypothetical protein